MDKKKTNKAMYDYVISIVDADGYDVTVNTDKEKIQFVWDTFNSEYGHNISRVGEQKAFIDWTQGLPSSFNVDYENYRIVEIGKEFGFLSDDATEKQEDKFIESWWARVYMAFRAAARKNKVELVHKMEKGGSVSGKSKNKAMYDYVIDAIDSEGYGVKTETDKEKVEFLWNTFQDEYGHEISRIGKQKAFEEWVSGLPSSFNIDFYNGDIIERGKEFGFLSENATDKQEDSFISSWWERLYMAFQDAARKNKVELSVEKYAKGGVVSKHDEEIKKLKAVVNSRNISENLKAKAQARIDMLEEKAGKSTPAPSQKKKVEKVMKEFKKGELTTHGKKVTKRKQAVAIALSEAGLSKAKNKGETVMEYAKRTRKSGESWNDAVKRSSKEIKNDGKPVAKKIKKAARKSKPVAKKIKKAATKKTVAKSTPKKIKKSASKKKAAQKLPRVIKRVKHLNGSTTVKQDKKVRALASGKRMSKAGNTYYEYRANRADLNRTKKLEEGGEI